ncbi:MAG TPA: ABC transporter ATP-binding protein [Hyphomicrobiaceae bacterium]
MPEVLRAERLTVRFGGVTAVDHVDLKLADRDILGLIGPNGAGKTTLFNALTGFVRPDEGAVFMFGREVTHLAPFQRARDGMGRTFQTDRPFEELTVLENVLIPAFLKHPSRRSAERIAREVLDEVGLSDRADQPAMDLNLARRRRLELARALAIEPRILFLDEIMAGLNPPALREMISFVRKLREKGLAILMVEHIMEAIIELCDHVIVLANGEKIAEGAPQQVVADSRVVEAYLGTD